MLHFNSLKKKHKAEDAIKPHRDPLPAHSIYRLADLAREMQEEEEHQLGVEQQKDSGLDFGVQLNDHDIQINFEVEDSDAPETVSLGVEDNEVEVKQLFATVQSASRSYREKQERLRAKWAIIYEELAWELLSLQATDMQGELPHCLCTERASKRVECIGLEESHFRDIFFCQKHPIHCELVRTGYFPSSPEAPKKAFHVRVLEFYRHLLGFGVSHQAWCSALWNMHAKLQSTGESLYHRPFIDTFSMYERARLWGNQITQNLLHRMEPNLDIGCVACPPPKEKRSPEDVGKMGIGWQMFACFDGNYGLKRMRNAQDAGTLLERPKAFFALDGEFDTFNDEYGRTRPNRRNVRTECINHFKAAQENSKAKERVEITGVFAVTCARHGWAYQGLNFRGTSERMIYALKILDWLIDEWGADSIRTLYDINCIFKKYVENSDLAQKARGVSYAISVFHAYAHNAKCQIQFNPRYIEGYGLTDGEWTERLWSYLVRFVAITKWMTPEHRTQVLEHAIVEWNSWIRMSFGVALTRRIRRCLEVENTSIEGLTRYRQVAGNKALDDDALLERWELHKAYLRQEDNAVELSPAERYFEALHQYDQAVVEAEQNGQHHTSVSRVERQGAELRRVGRMLEGLEGIDNEHRWPIDGPQYQDGLVKLHRRKLVAIVSELHRLVVAKSLEVLRFHQGRHIGTKQAQKMMEGLRRTNQNIKTQLAKMKEVAKDRPELAQFVVADLSAVMKPDGPFWAQYTIWLAGQGRILLPCELAAVRHFILLKHIREEKEILEAEVYRMKTWARARVAALQLCIHRAEDILAEKQASLDELDPTACLDGIRQGELICGQLAIYKKQLQETTIQLGDFEVRFSDVGLWRERLAEEAIDDEITVYDENEDGNLLELESVCFGDEEEPEIEEFD